MNDYIDNDVTTNFPDFSLNDMDKGIDIEHLEIQEREHERVRIEKRFTDMNYQICELTSLVKNVDAKVYL